MSKPKRIKIVAMGDRSAEQLLNVYTLKKPHDDITSPTTDDLYEVTINGIAHEVMLLDTAGADNYELLLRLCFPRTTCFIICYSITSKDSFERVHKLWVPSIRNYSKQTPILLVGTQSERRSNATEDVIGEQDGRWLQKQIKAFKYMECSLVNNEGIDEIFETAIGVRRQRTCNLI